MTCRLSQQNDDKEFSNENKKESILCRFTASQKPAADDDDEEDEDDEDCRYLWNNEENKKSETALLVKCENNESDSGLKLFTQ